VVRSVIATLLQLGDSRCYRAVSVSVLMLVQENASDDACFPRSRYGHAAGGFKLQAVC
jgi:hypothetical protein